MVKKLKGEIFLLSANDLLTGKVVFYSPGGWSFRSNDALKINIKDIEKFQRIIEEDEKRCIIVSPEFVELDESGHIKKLRDKIRNSGVTIEI